MAMKGILGRKLGMTQIFDEETGNVEAVTVIEAGPVPGRHGADRRRPTATRPSSSRSSAVVDRKLSKGELGHLRKAGVGGHRHLVEFRGASELQAGETVTVEAFEPGDRIKVSGVSIGKGFQGTIKRHNFSRGPMSHGSHNVRKPGSIGASATPSRVFKGKKMAGHMGAAARHPARARRPRGGRRAEPAPRPRLGAGPEERAGRDPRSRALMAVKATVLGGSAKDVALDATVFEAEVKPHLLHETVRAELNAARAGRAARRAAGSSPAAARSRGARRAPAAPARARSARRSSRAAVSRSRPGCGASTSR